MGPSSVIDQITNRCFSVSQHCLFPLFMQSMLVGVSITQYAFVSPHSENMLFGMGNPLLDISAVVDKDFLDK